MLEKNIADLLVEKKAIQFGNFLLASGRISNYYVDIKTAATDPILLRLIGSFISMRYKFDVVAGIAVGGVPLAVATSMISKKPYAIIRKAEKDHGQSNLIIGDVKDKKILLVEDVTTSGGSALYGINVIRAAGGTIDNVITVVDREQGAEKLLFDHAVQLHSIVKIDNLINKHGKK